MPNPAQAQKKLGGFGTPDFGGLQRKPRVVGRFSCCEHPPSPHGLSIGTHGDSIYIERGRPPGPARGCGMETQWGTVTQEGRRRSGANGVAERGPDAPLKP